ncbi:uncharacterized protein [Physcomitrium patens]|uniref:SBP-type domain-containing protein n=1 Tax=Physcomitrium patens TaxID=3218 RepID=A0A2K1KEN3_PHYPA|nr:squamosa promoter-binding-like protein 14 isoform X2 [Physcomitrium patens]PNR52241.1 hypothetical protein PHYPA_008615 [Physcomitrium patens]|eukprot:XP_024378733.1 squamosa promoter-binding-like protein 14 isoform X2 [Physcomitrella patens]
MNSSTHTNEQQGDLSWSTENWDNPGAVSTFDQASRPYNSANRQEWEWDPMILAQHPGSGGSADDGSHDGDCLKNHISGGTMSSFRTTYNMNMLSAGLPSNFTQNPMGIFSSAGIRHYGSLDGPGQLSTSNIHSALGPSGIPGLAATSGSSLDNDIRSYDQRRREFIAAGMHNHHVKREEVNDGHARIGLNLGVRTYFSTEDTTTNRLVKRHRAGSPGPHIPLCQAEGCKSDLSTAKQYHRRHKVCELHSKAPNVVAGGQTQRFCQQCSRFHSLGEFDDGKRSCRKRLADHNRRRRKPQPYASAPGGTSAECIGIKNGEDNLSDSKSLIIPLKSRSSPSSVSLEDSDEKPGSAGNNLHLRSSSQGYGRAPCDDQHSSHSEMQMTSQAMTGSDSLLSAMSSVPLMLQNAKRQMTMIGGTGNHGHDHSIYQQHLHVQTGSSTGKTGPNLSLSSLGGQLGLSHQGGGRSQTIPGQIYNGLESPVSWLRPLNPRSDLTHVVGRQSAMNLQHLMSNDSKSGITSASANSSNTQEHDVQAFSPSSQNLIPRDIASPEWMLGSMAGQAPRTGSNPYGTSALNNLSGNGQLESGHQIMSLIDQPNQGCGHPGNGGCNQTVQGSHTPMEFMQQHNTVTEADSGGDNTSRGGGSTVDSPDMKYPELQALRPYASGPSSIFNSRHTLLSGNFSYETMA